MPFGAQGPPISKVFDTPFNSEDSGVVPSPGEFFHMLYEDGDHMTFEDGSRMIFEPVP